VTGTPFADLLAAAGPDWRVGRNSQLGLWTAEKVSDGGHSIHYLVAHSASELADKIAAADLAEVQGT
jgi:hypothetical protein